jgi:hypothetical protein
MANLHHPILILLAFLLYGNVTAVAQGAIGFSLNEKMEESVANKFRIVVYLNEKANLGLLESELKQNQVPVKNRPLLVKQALLEVALASQQNLLAAVESEFGASSLTHSDIQKLWINNCLVMWANEEMIEFIAYQPSVELVDLNVARKIRLLDPPKRSNSVSNRTPGAAEPGLISIGANLLWDMGYTGKNRISYSIDTGV